MLIFWTILINLPSPASACAGLFHDDESIVESDVQEAIFTVNADDTVTVSYRVTYEGDAANFGWVIPIPSPFVSLDDGDEEDFLSLEELTAPVATWDYGDGGDEDEGCGCGADSKALGGGDNSDSALGGVDIVAEGFAGPYTYTVIEAASSDDLLAWLTENGWTVRESGADIAAYVSDGGFQFVAITLTPESAETPPEGRQLPPVDIVYGGSEVLYPARMARGSMTEQLRTTLWVVAPHQYTLSAGWTEATLAPITGDVNADPTTLFQEALGDVAGDTAAYALTWSGSGTAADSWITRFDTLANREVHTADAVFGQAAADESVQTTIALSGGTPDTAFFLPLAAGGYGLVRRRRRRTG